MSLEQRIESIKSENAEHKRVSSEIKEWKDIFRSVDKDLQSDFLDKDKLENSIQVLQGTLQTCKTKMATTAAENERRTKSNTRIQVIQEQT